MSRPLAESEDIFTVTGTGRTGTFGHIEQETPMIMVNMGSQQNEKLITFFQYEAAGPTPDTDLIVSAVQMRRASLLPGK